MPYQPSWYDQDKSIIRVDIQGAVSWDEWYELTNQLVEMLSSVAHRVDIIYDDKVGMPAGNPIPHLKATNARLMAKGNLGTVVTVSSRRISGIVKAMVDVVMRAYRMDMRHYGGFVDTLDEALHMLESTRKLKLEKAASV